MFGVFQKTDAYCKLLKPVNITSPISVTRVLVEIREWLTHATVATGKMLENIIIF